MARPEQPLDPPHQPKALAGYGGRYALDHATLNSWHSLPADRQKQSSELRRAHLPELLAKKSRLAANCPIST